MHAQRILPFGLGMLLFAVSSWSDAPAMGGTDETRKASESRETSSASDAGTSAKGNPSLADSKRQRPTTGTIVGRITTVAGAPRNRPGFSISSLFSLRPEGDAYLYSPPTAEGKRELVSRQKADRAGRFCFKSIPPGNDYRVSVTYGLGVKSFHGDLPGVSVVAGQTTDVGDIASSK